MTYKCQQTFAVAGIAVLALGSNAACRGDQDDRRRAACHPP